MGTISHHAIVVTATYGDYAERAHAKALGIFNERLVSPLSPGVVNGTRSFCVFPDGSKEGWDESADGDRKRDVFIEWLNLQRYCDGSTPYRWAEVNYGEGADGPGDGASVTRDYYVPTGDDYAGPHELDVLKEA